MKTKHAKFMAVSSFKWYRTGLNTEAIKDGPLQALDHRYS